mgnify:CR=1 FL=1
MDKMFKQENIKWEYTKVGIKKTTTVTDFKNDEKIESFYSSIYPYPDSNASDLDSINEDENEDLETELDMKRHYKIGQKYNRKKSGRTNKKSNV